MQVKTIFFKIRHLLVMQATLLVFVQLFLPSLGMAFHFDHSQCLPTFREMSESAAFSQPEVCPGLDYTS